MSKASAIPDVRYPWQFGVEDWKAILKRVWGEIGNDDLSVRASAVALSALFSIPTLLVAVVSTYGLVASPEQVRSLVDATDLILPNAATEILSGQLDALVSSDSGALSLGLIFGLAGAIWTISGGVNRVRDTINEVYEEVDERPWYVKRAWSALASVGVIALIVASVGLIAVLPASLDWIGVTGTLRTVLLLGRWVVLGLVLMSLLTAIYRLGPNRTPARFVWLSAGTLLATVAWLIMSVGFSIYVQNFASYNETYGSLGTVLAFMTWLYLSSYILLIAGEFNAELEHQTRYDTTIDGEQPMGERGAYVADTVPASETETAAANV